MKFRKKPIVVQAEQWFHGKEIDGVDEYFIDVLGVKIKKHRVKTLEGNMEVSPGDWIITGVEGEKYPCKPDIFDKTYEKEIINAMG